MTPRTLLVTNDFPPGVGGIQVVQEQLFGRLDPDRLHVLASRHPQAGAFDASSPFEVTRFPQGTLLPTPLLRRRVREEIDRIEPDVVVFGSALPLGLMGDIPAGRGVPHVCFVYGADVPVPSRLPVVSRMLRSVLRGCSGLVAMGPWVAERAQRAAGREIDICCVYPGVDADRFSPGDAGESRRALGLDPERPTVTSISRLVPRKGMHLLVAAAADLARRVPGVQVAIGGDGRERRRLEGLIRAEGVGDVVVMLGRVPDELVVHVHRAADVSTMLCHDRWLGLEEEGFGIVFVEAGACGRPVVAGRSGGSVDAVEDGVTGTLVDARSRVSVVGALTDYLSDASLASRVGSAGRHRAEKMLTWDHQGSVFVEWMSRRYA